MNTNSPELQQARFDALKVRRVVARAFRAGTSTCACERIDLTRVAIIYGHLRIAVRIRRNRCRSFLRQAGATGWLARR